MKIFRAIPVLVIFLGCFLLIFSPTAVYAEVAQSKVDIIKDHCASAQSIMQQLQRRDAVSRINRGRSYDLLLRQVEAMNARLAYNKVQVDTLTTATGDIQNGVDRFRAAYTQYDQALGEAIAINCRENPVDFYVMVGKAQSERTVVGEEIKRIETAMQQYRDGIVAHQMEQAQ